MALTFYYDFSSTYSYLSAMRLEEMAAAQGVEVVWRPFLLGPIFAEAAYGGTPNLATPAKAAYMWRDLSRTAAHRGIGFQKPEVFPLRSVAAGRAALGLPDGERPGFTRAVYTEAFGKGRDISNPAVLADAARAAGLDPDRVAALTQDPDVKAALFKAVEDARAAGVFGAPAFVAADGELFWGDDRLQSALAWEKTGALPRDA